MPSVAPGVPPRAAHCGAPCLGDMACPFLGRASRYHLIHHPPTRRGFTNAIPGPYYPASGSSQRGRRDSACARPGCKPVACAEPAQQSRPSPKRRRRIFRISRATRMPHSQIMMKYAVRARDSSDARNQNHIFPSSLCMFLRALKRLLPQLQPTTAAATLAFRSEARYGPKSLECLKAEAKARHDFAHDAYMKALQAGHAHTSFGHLVEAQHHREALVALNTGAWSRIAYIKTAPLAAPVTVVDIASPLATRPPDLSAGVLKADAASRVGRIGGGGVAIQPGRANRTDAGLRSAIDRTDTSFGVSEALHLGA